MRFSTFSADGQTTYGAATDAGMIALGEEFPDWPTLFDAVVAGGLDALAEAASGRLSRIQILTMRRLCRTPRGFCVLV